MADTWVSIQDVSFTRQQKQIFSNINLTVPRGKITAIMGPSGCGKTTLLHLIGGLIAPNSGHITVNQQEIHQLSSKGLAKARKDMGLLFQNGALFTHLSVFDNVAFPLREHTQLTEQLIRHIVLMKLEAVGLRGTHTMMPEALSGGMARRVAFARAMALDPELMMFDEPFTGQDPISMGVLLKLIQHMNQLLQTTVIVVSHDIQETLQIADYIYLLAKGTVIAHGEPDVLLASDVPQVKQFMHGEADGVVPFHYPAQVFKEELLHA